MNSTTRIVLVVILVLLVIGMLPAWPYSAGWGYYPSGGLGLSPADPPTSGNGSR